MHPQLAALLVLGDGLDHRPEDVRVDLGPVEAADMQQVGPGDLAELRHVHAAGEQAAVHVGEAVGPAGNLGGCPVLFLRVHGAEQRADDLMGVGRVPRAHLRDGFGELALADEDVGVLGEEAEDQPRHEVVHVVAALGLAPIGVVLQEFDVEPVKAAGRPDIEGVLGDLPDGADARQRQEEAEVVGEVLEGAGDRLAAGQVFGLEVRAVGGEDELRLGLGGGGAVLERLERLRDLPCLAGQDVDVVGLENAAEVGLVRRPGAKALDRRRLVAEGFKEGIGEVRSVEGLLRKVGDGLLDLNRVQRYLPPPAHRGSFGVDARHCRCSRLRTPA